MLGRAISYLVESYTFVQLLVQTFACCAIRWMECCIVAIGASSAAHFTISVRASEAGVQHDLLQTLSVFSLEISYE
jgi:hypothetical protein